MYYLSFVTSIEITSKALYEVSELTCHTKIPIFTTFLATFHNWNYIKIPKFSSLQIITQFISNLHVSNLQQLHKVSSPNHECQKFLARSSLFTSLTTKLLNIDPSRIFSPLFYPKTSFELLTYFYIFVNYLHVSSPCHLLTFTLNNEACNSTLPNCMPHEPWKRT
jgi:hypothetical protein